MQPPTSVPNPIGSKAIGRLDLQPWGSVLGTPQARVSDPAVLSPEEWVDAYGDELYNFANMRLRNPSEAEEAVQETFLAAVEKWSQFRGSSQIAWLIGILRNKIVDIIRDRQKRHPTTEIHRLQLTDRLASNGSFDWLYSIPTMDPNNDFEMTELWQLIQTCMTTLNRDQVDVFTLSVLEQMDMPTISTTLNLSLRNARVRLHRARVNLARCVSKKWDWENR